MSHGKHTVLYGAVLLPLPREKQSCIFSQIMIHSLSNHYASIKHVPLSAVGVSPRMCQASGLALTPRTHRILSCFLSKCVCFIQNCTCLKRWGVPTLQTRFMRNKWKEGGRDVVSSVVSHSERRRSRKQPSLSKCPWYKQCYPRKFLLTLVGCAFKYGIRRKFTWPKAGDGSKMVSSASFSKHQT